MRLRAVSIGASISAVIAFFQLTSCGPKQTEKATVGDTISVHLITLDPGHFHAALVQKSMYPGIDSVVKVYAPDGPELKAHLDLINQYNSRPDSPTHWSEKVYTGPDYFEKMLAEKTDGRGANVVVMAGNNRLKTHYINESVRAGLNVLGDKPMAINKANFDSLTKAFDDAKSKKVLLYDIMTERSEIATILQRELSRIPEVFGQQQQGTAAQPGVVMESIHYYSKQVSGKTLTRPAWFFDPTQQGEAIADVGTHLVDLVQWECFPDQVLDYKKDINVLSGRLWPTPVGLSAFKAITKLDSFPAFLRPYVKDSTLMTHGNGEVGYTLKGLHVKVTARWELQALAGGDSHYSLLRGTKANLEIRQGKEENYKPQLYVIPVGGTKDSAAITKAMQELSSKYNGVHAERAGNAWKIVAPDALRIGHEAHFSQVMQRYLRYLKTGSLPEWEVPGMLAKYYTTTTAVEIGMKHPAAGK